jgi:hypothetical protein
MRYERCEVSMEMALNMSLFWDAALSLVDVHISDRAAASIFWTGSFTYHPYLDISILYQLSRSWT